MSETYRKKRRSHLMIVVMYYYMMVIIIMIIPMDVTSLPIATDDKDVHFEKASAPFDYNYILSGKFSNSSDDYTNSTSRNTNGYQRDASFKGRGTYDNGMLYIIRG